MEFHLKEYYNYKYLINKLNKNQNLLFIQNLKYKYPEMLSSYEVEKKK